MLNRLLRYSSVFNSSVGIAMHTDLLNIGFSYPLQKPDTHLIKIRNVYFFLGFGYSRSQGCFANGLGSCLCLVHRKDIFKSICNTYINNLILPDLWKHKNKGFQEISNITWISKIATKLKSRIRKTNVITKKMDYNWHTLTRVFSYEKFPSHCESGEVKTLSKSVFLYHILKNIRIGKKYKFIWKIWVTGKETHK